MKRVVKSTEISEGNKFVAFFPNLINTFTAIIESLLLIRVFLRLFNANEQNIFVNFIYNISAVFIRPFINIFENIEIRSGMVLEINTLIAILVYGLLAWIIISLFANFTHKEVNEEFIEMD